LPWRRRRYPSADVADPDTLPFVLVTSRSYDEYVAMFGLGPVEMSGSILDCAAGAADFGVRVREAGGRAVAVDPVYARPRGELADAARADLERGSAIADTYPDRFVWDWYGSRERRETMRRAAVARFLGDFAVTPSAYVAGALPRLPFTDGAADLLVCSHLLFTWADTLGLPWHEAAVLEMTRVAGQVRLFPTVLQGTGDPVPFWDELLLRLRGAGVTCEVRQVDYRFQRTGDRMLVVSRR
jgi:hypothetical protein